jgi:hypothetical protein
MSSDAGVRPAALRRRRHLDDAAIRLRDRKALREVLQMGPGPGHCGNGHAQDEYGRCSPAGVSYCHRCKLDRKNPEAAR